MTAVDEKVMSLDIVTPLRLVFSGEVVKLSAPGTEGSFSILNRHADFVTSLQIGEIRLVTKDGQTQKFAISGGFVEVKNNKIILLAETAERAEEIDVERAKSAKERAERRLTTRSTEVDDLRARIALMKAINRMKVTTKL